MKYKHTQPVVDLLRVMRKLDLMSQSAFINFYYKHVGMLISRNVSWWRRRENNAIP